MAVNSSIGLIEATDLDSDLLYYTLDPSTVNTITWPLPQYVTSICITDLKGNTFIFQSKYFRLQTENYPKLLVQKIVEYDVIQKMTLILYVQVWPLKS